MSKKTKQNRQGDIFFETVAKPPKGKPLTSNILAYGEVTGHSHAIMSPALSELDTVVDQEGDIFVFSKSAPIKVGHDEHDTITLDAGEWHCISRQREFDPVLEEQRRVAD